jgi:hypothetical protein
MASRPEIQLSLWPMNYLNCSLTVIKPYSLVVGYQSFTGTWGLHFQDSFFLRREKFYFRVMTLSGEDKRFERRFIFWRFRCNKFVWSLISWGRKQHVLPKRRHPLIGIRSDITQEASVNASDEMHAANQKYGTYFGTSVLLALLFRNW